MQLCAWLGKFCTLVFAYWTALWALQGIPWLVQWLAAAGLVLGTRWLARHVWIGRAPVRGGGSSRPGQRHSQPGQPAATPGCSSQPGTTSNRAASPSLQPDWHPDAWRQAVGSELVSGAWEVLCNSIVQEFIYNAFFSSLSPDTQFPAAVRWQLNHAFAAVCCRARRVEWSSVLIRDCSAAICSTLQLYREAAVAIGAAELKAMPADAADKAITEALGRSGSLHPAFGSPTGHYKCCQRLSESVLRQVMPSDDWNCIMLRTLLRELLATLVLRSCLALVSPGSINKLLLNAMTASPAGNNQADAVTAQAAAEFVRRAQDTCRAETAVHWDTAAAQAEGQTCMRRSRSVGDIRAGAAAAVKKQAASSAAAGRKQLSVIATIQETTSRLVESRSRQQDAARSSPARRAGSLASLVPAGTAALLPSAWPDSPRSRSAVELMMSPARSGGDGKPPPHQRRRTAAGGSPGGIAMGLDARVVAAEMLHLANSKTAVVYRVNVRDGSSEWAVTRRFRHFEALNRRLKELRPRNGLLLPPKRLLTARDEPFVRQRREELDAYLQAVLSSPLRSVREVLLFLSPKSPMCNAADGTQPLQLQLLRSKSDNWLHQQSDPGSPSNRPHISRSSGSGSGSGSSSSSSSGSDSQQQTQELQQQQQQQLSDALHVTASTPAGSKAADRQPATGHSRQAGPPAAVSSMVAVAYGVEQPLARRELQQQQLLGPPGPRRPGQHARHISCDALQVPAAWAQDTRPAARSSGGALHPAHSPGLAGEGSRQYTVQSPERQPAFPAPDKGDVCGTQQPETSTCSTTTSGSNSPAHARGRAAAAEQFATADNGGLDAPDSISAPLLDVVSCVFQLEAKGFVRRPVITLVRQLLSLLAGGAIDDWLRKCLAQALSEANISAQVHLLQQRLWPGGTFYAHAAAAAAAAAPAAAGSAINSSSGSSAGAASAGAGAAGRRPAGPMAAEAYLRWPVPDDHQQVTLQLRHKLFSQSVPGPLLALVGKQGFHQSLEDVWGMLQSTTLMTHLGLCLLECVAAALFPEVSA